MPPRTKRNATSRRHPPSTPPQPRPAYDPDSDQHQHTDLLSFDNDDDAPHTYGTGTLTPAVFEPEPPPSDPELGRASASICADPTAAAAAEDRYLPRHSHPKYEHEHEDVYARAGLREDALYGTSESDVDDGGPASASTSPPGPSSLRTGTFAITGSGARSVLSKLAAPTPGEDTSDESSLGRSVGHVRSPVLAR
ncbi:hypothetical protein C8Q80DRAFT_1269093 [Daedaleopsis nitida]|nr:hypothetical protein C8Q80DRAFT_1269093 [Daedaleopsis nitida]